MGAIKTIRQSTQAELQWFCAGLQYLPQLDLKGLTGIDASGNVVALVGFDGWTHGSVCLHSWISPGALTRAFLREVARYPFSTGRRVLIGKTPASNTRALRFNRHYGFEETYRIRDGFADGVDLIIQELRHDKCRWYKHDGNGSCSSYQPEQGRRSSGPSSAGGPETSSAPGFGGTAPSIDSRAATDDPASPAAANVPVRRPCPDWSDATRGPCAVSSDAGPASPATDGRPVGHAALGPNEASGTGTAPDERCGGGPINPDAYGAHAPRRWYSPSGPDVYDGVDEDVSIEPRCDIEAQLDDLVRPGSKRVAVFLSPRNADYHQWVWDDPRVGAFDIMSTDGVMLFKRRQDCEEMARKFRQAGRQNMRRVIGEAVLAGPGKPAFTPDAVVAQMCDNDGNVARESIQPSRGEAYGKIIDWMKDYPAGCGQLVTLQQALSRRSSLVYAAADVISHTWKSPPLCLHPRPPINAEWASS